MKSLLNVLIFLWDKLINTLYPKQCLLCKKINEDAICVKCYRQLKLVNKIDNYKNKNFKEHLYIFKYDEKIRELIIDYKFNDKAYINELFVKIILKNKKICRKIKKYDIIIPVPIHIKRKRERGYNQSELIVCKIAKKLGLTVIKNNLIKQKNTVPQSLLTKEQRQENAKNVYKLINEQKIENKKIILFDDIYTTGATANECAKVLKQKGAKEILIFTLAKD